MPAEHSPANAKRKPPASDAFSASKDANTHKFCSAPRPGTTVAMPGPNAKLEATKAKCLYLINHEFRALQLDRQMATMSVFDLIDHCASLFEKSTAAKDADIDESFRLYVRSFLIFNYFVNTFIMLHFNGFSHFMASSHQDFIIYLNLYNFYKSDDIVGPHAFHVSPQTVRGWVVEYLVSKKLLTFDVDLLYAWLDEYVEYLKGKDSAEAAEATEAIEGLDFQEGDPEDSLEPVFPGSSDSIPEKISGDDLFDFNTRFPDLPPLPQSPNTRRVPSGPVPAASMPKAPYPVSEDALEESILPYPLEKYSVEKNPREENGRGPGLEENPHSYSRPQLQPPPLPPAIPVPKAPTHTGVERDHVPYSSQAFPIISGSAIGLAAHVPGASNGFQRHVTDPPTQKAGPSIAYPSGQPQPGSLYPLESPRRQSKMAPNGSGHGFERASTSSGVYTGSHSHEHKNNMPKNPQSHRSWPSNRSGAYNPNERPRQGPPKSYAVCGMKNMGSSCYINSTVQVLVGLEKFETSLHHRKKRQTLQPLTDVTAGLITTFIANSGANIAPTKFLRILSSLKPDFNIPFEQQDAQEFLLFLLDKLHEELAVRPRGEPVDYLQKWNITVNSKDTEEYLKWYKDLLDYDGESPINDTFQGHVQSKLVCNKCGHRSVSYSPFTILSLPIPAGNNQTVDLTDCLRYYTQDEVLTGENAWHCPKCNKTTDKENPMDVVFQPKRGLFRLKRSKSPSKKNSALHSAAHKNTSVSIKQLSFIKLPPVMFIHLSRFSMSNVTDKLNTNIAYPLRLKFNHSTHDIYYSLTGIINHYGTLKSGHYTALVNKSRAHGPNGDTLFDPMWCYFDDDHVRINVQHGNVHSNEHSKIHSRDVYVLCYERV